jgi:putative ABC transport system substrate-binding protein
MQRRKFITLIGAAAAWPVVARAQHPMPVIGFLSSQSPDTYAVFPGAFQRGLKEAGYVDGNNVKIEYRWAQGRLDRLPKLASDLVRRQVHVIAATGGVASAHAAELATTSIPIVFNSGEDPVRAGLVSNLNRPGGNVTGISWFSVDLTAKRLALLHQIVPTAAVVGFLMNPNDTEISAQLAAIKAAALELRLQLVVANAASANEIEAAFIGLRQQNVRAVFVASGPTFVNQRAQLIALAAQHAMPCIYSGKESPAAGGLMSYGNNLEDAYRRNGLYVGRILKGEKPGDLPVDRATKFELVINLKTARALGLSVSPTLLATADEVIE